MPGPQSRADDQRVVVEPDRALLPLGQEEAALDKARGLDIEFAQFGGVLAAVRQADKTAAIFRPQRDGAVEHPVASLGGGQRVDVEQRPPIRLGGRERGKAGARHSPR